MQDLVNAAVAGKTYVYSISFDPSIKALSAYAGTLALGVGSNPAVRGKLWQKQDAGSSTNWKLISVGALKFQAAWDANTNTPALTALTPEIGSFWIVTVAGATVLGGITPWAVDDWAVYGASGWVKIPNSDLVTQVNGQTGIVSLAASDIPNDSTLPGASTKDALENLIIPSRVIYVDKNRADIYTANGSQQFPYKTIAEAVAVATGKALIKVMPATTGYTEDVVLPDGVSLEGYAANSTIITGSVTTGSGAPISLKYLQFNGVAKTLTINCACTIRDCFSNNQVITNNASIQGYNFHIIATGTTALILNGAASNFQDILCTISSTLDFPTILCNNGRLTLELAQVFGGRAVSEIISSPAGTLKLINSVIANTLGGKAIVCNNGATALNPNLFHGLFTVGITECGTAVSLVDNITGPLSGTALVYPPASRYANDSSVAGATIKDALNALLGGAVTSFLGLSDTPASYVGQAGLFAKVNVAETGLEFGAGGGGGGGSTLNLTGTLNFAAETSKDLDILMGVDAASLVSARLYVNTYPGAAFNQIATLKLYSNPARKDNQLLYIAELPLICNSLALAANPADTSITLNSAAGFVKYDLMYLMGATPEFRRISNLALNVASVMSNVENAHLLGDGVSNAAEIGELVFLDDSGAKKIYARLEFAAAQTVSVNLDVVARG